MEIRAVRIIHTAMEIRAVREIHTAMEIKATRGLPIATEVIHPMATILHILTIVRETVPPITMH